jgi:hypothetical protein
VKVTVTVSQERTRDNDESRYNRWDSVATFDVECDQDVAWQVFRDALAALTESDDGEIQP